MDNFWHRLMSKTHSFKLTIHTWWNQHSRKRKHFFSLQVIFYIVWNFVMKIPSHHASSHYRQNDNFFFLSQWNTHSLPNRTLPFLHPNHDPVLYISDALDLPQREDSETDIIDRFRSRRTDRREDLSCCRHRFFPYYVKKIEKKKNSRPTSCID